MDILSLGLFVEDGHLGFEIGSLNIGDQTPFETRSQAFNQAGNLLGRRIARNDDLLLVIMQLVEGVKELLLRTLFSAENLDIVYQQYVCFPIPLVKLLHALSA